jgi:hypothetical protein
LLNDVKLEGKNDPTESWILTSKSIRYEISSIVWLCFVFLLNFIMLLWILTMWILWCRSTSQTMLYRRVQSKHVLSNAFIQHTLLLNNSYESHLYDTQIIWFAHVWMLANKKSVECWNLTISHKWKIQIIAYIYIILR